MLGLFDLSFRDIVGLLVLCYIWRWHSFFWNKLAKLGDAIAISNFKLSMTDPLTD